MMAENRKYNNVELSVDKKVLYYGDSFIMIDNISLISITQIPPNISWIVALLIGICAFAFTNIAPIAWLIVTGCLIWLVAVIYDNTNRGENLNISLNSGINLYFTCNNKEFLRKVLNRLLETIKDGSNSKYIINMERCIIGEAFNNSTLS